MFLFKSIEITNPDFIGTTSGISWDRMFTASFNVAHLKKNPFYLYVNKYIYRNKFCLILGSGQSQPLFGLLLTAYASNN